MSGSFDTEGYFRLRSRSTREEISGRLEDTGPSHEEVPGDSTLSHPGQESGQLLQGEAGAPQAGEEDGQPVGGEGVSLPPGGVEARGSTGGDLEEQGARRDQAAASFLECGV